MDILQKGNVISRIILLLLALALLEGCRQQRTYGMPIDALTEFPGYLNAENAHSFQLLARRELPRGDVLLYAFRGTRPEVEGMTCVATTFVSENEEGRWRAQSSSNMGCRPDFPDPEEFILRHTAGGNITGLATVYGLTPAGETVRVRWADGEVTMAGIDDGHVLLSRPETVQPDRIEILDADGNVIHSKPIR